MVVEMVPLSSVGLVAFFTPQKARTISGKKPANWGMDYATDPTF